MNSATTREDVPKMSEMCAKMRIEMHMNDKYNPNNFLFIEEDDLGSANLEFNRFGLHESQIAPPSHLTKQISQGFRFIRHIELQSDEVLRIKRVVFIPFHYINLADSELQITQSYFDALLKSKKCDDVQIHYALDDIAYYNEIFTVRRSIPQYKSSIGNLIRLMQFIYAHNIKIIKLVQETHASAQELKLAIGEAFHNLITMEDKPRFVFEKLAKLLSDEILYSRCELPA